MSLGALSARACATLINREDQLVAQAVKASMESIIALIEAASPGFMAGGRLVYLGAGTSGRLGVLDAAEAPPTFQVEPGRVVGLIAGGTASLTRSSEGLEDDPRGAQCELDALQLTPRDTLIGIAAGGTTPYVLGGLKHVSEHNTPPLVALLTCTPIDRPAFLDHLITLDTGPEVLTGSTRMKAGSATKMVLNTISTTLMVCDGRVHENLMVDLLATNDKLRDRAARIITQLTDLSRPASLDLLDRADGVVKVALVMHHNRVSQAQARAVLDKTQDRLHGILSDEGDSP
jgi:N-acetylmuramic acid 6-phosphate etherase